MADIHRLLALDLDVAARREAVSALRELFPKAEIIEGASQRLAQASWSGPAPDLVALGFALSEENGLDAAERIRRLAPETRLMLYAPAVPESVREALAAIGCAVLTAPVTADKIVAALDCCAAEQALSNRAAAAMAYA